MSTIKEERFTPRQVDIIRGKMPAEQVRNIDIKLILEKCKRFDLPDIAHDLLRRYQTNYEPYSSYERQLLKGTVLPDSRAQVWKLIQKVEIEEGPVVASQLFDRFEHYLTGVYPDMHEWTSIKECIDLMDELSGFKTNWHYDELYPDGDERKLYGKPRRIYYKYFMPPCDDSDDDFPYLMEDDYTSDD